MSDVLTTALKCVALALGGILLFMVADPVRRFIGRTPDYWDKESVIRNGWEKLWREDDPQRFDSRVSGVRDSGFFVWLFLKVFGAILVCTSIIHVLGLFAK